MATKKNTGAKTPKNEEKKVQQTAAENPIENERPQYKVPFISAKIDRFNDNPDAKIKANASVTIGTHFAVHGLKIYDGDDGKGPRVMYPSTKGTHGGVGKAPAFQFFHGVKVSAPLFGGFPFLAGGSLAVALCRVAVAPEDSGLIRRKIGFFRLAALAAVQ